MRFISSTHQSCSFSNSSIGFESCKVEFSTLVGCSIETTSSTFRHSTIKGCYFGRDCTDNDFDSAKISGSSFAKADLSNSSFKSATLDNVDFRGAILKGVSFSGAKGLETCKFDSPPEEDEEEEEEITERKDNLSLSSSSRSLFVAYHAGETSKPIIDFSHFPTFLLSVGILVIVGAAVFGKRTTQ